MHQSAGLARDLYGVSPFRVQSPYL
jgi:hypothetical protein